MNKQHIFSLVIMTIFATLFLISFVEYRATKSRLILLEKEVSAFKALIRGDLEDFNNAMKSLGKEKDAEFYTEKFLNILLERGRMEMENHNLAKAYEFFSNVYQISDKPLLKLKAAYLCGKVLNEMKDHKRAHEFLEIFLKEKNSIFYKDALIELAIASKGIGDSTTLKKIESILENDPVYSKKLREVER